MTPKIATSTTLSLSIGATRAASPSFNARKWQSHDAGCESRKRKERIGAAGYFRQRLPLIGGGDDRRQYHDDNDRAQERRKIGVHILDADLGKDRRQRHEDRRQDGPGLPRLHQLVHGAAPCWIA